MTYNEIINDLSWNNTHSGFESTPSRKRSVSFKDFVSNTLGSNNTPVAPKSPARSPHKLSVKRKVGAFGLVQSSASMAAIDTDVDNANLRKAEAVLTELGYSPAVINDSLRKLSQNKSGITCKATDSVNFIVKWPHEKIFRLSGEAAEYKNLTMSEFVAGIVKVFEMCLP